MKPYLHKLVHKHVLLILVGFFICNTSFSQSFLFGKKIRYEAGICLGPTFFLGDLGGNTGKGTNFLKDWNYETMTLSKTIFFSAYPSNWLGARFQATMLTLSGDDALINTMGIDELWRKQRNLDFKTKVWEANLGFEIYPLMLLNRYKEEEPRFRPYGVIGGGVFHFNPQGSLTDANGNKSWHYLQPLRLEGQGMTEYPESKPYKLTQLNMLYGAGFKYFISERTNIGIEVVYRKTFTDYLDDVSLRYIDQNDFPKYLSAADASLASKLSDKTIGIIYPGMTRYPAGTQRGDLKDADSYFTTVLKIGVRLGPGSQDPVLRQLRCPSVY